MCFGYGGWRAAVESDVLSSGSHDINAETMFCSKMGLTPANEEVNLLACTICVKKRIVHCACQGLRGR